MLETTELLDGKEGKELDKLLAEYEDLKTKLDDLKKVQEKVVEGIKTICNHKASYETLNYYFKMDNRKTADKFNKKGLQEKYPDIFKEFTTISESYSLVIGTITRKGQRS